MRLSEVFASSGLLPYTWGRPPSDYSLTGWAHFSTASGVKYEVDFARPMGKRNEISVELMFVAKQPGQHGSVDIINTNESVSVISTVVAITREFIAAVPIEALYFSAEQSEPSRIKLYDRLARTLMPDWTLQKTHHSTAIIYRLQNPNYNRNVSAS